MNRADFQRFCALDIDFEAIGLMEPGAPQVSYFCTPVGAEHIGRLGCDGVHFVFLPEDERVFCVDPSMGDIGTYVLPVASDFREFLSYVICCSSAGLLSQIFWMNEDTFLEELEAAQEDQWPADSLDSIAEAFHLEPIYPYERVKRLQAQFDPDSVAFSDEYYDTLGIERK